jgi:hypothetical protein
MPVKRPVDDDDGDAGAHANLPAKHSRLDLHIDYDQQHPQSASARKKGSSNRTGQACDRCKVRANLPVCCYLIRQALYRSLHWRSF